jgi:hypothetical protein
MSRHSITDRVNRIRDRAKGRISASRIDRLDRDNERLRSEVEVLRTDLDEERTSFRDAVADLSSRKHVTVKAQRRPHVLRAVIIAGAAYVLGTRAGRERYDQIMAKTRSLSGRIRVRAQGDGTSTPWNLTEPESIVPPAAAGNSH